jgi:Sulfatase
MGAQRIAGAVYSFREKFRTTHCNIAWKECETCGQPDSTAFRGQGVRTPAMQRLAEAGVTFTRALIASPACVPSRAAMLTGLMHARDGAEANHSFKRDDVASLPALLRKLGLRDRCLRQGGMATRTGRGTVSM